MTAEPSLFNRIEDECLDFYASCIAFDDVTEHLYEVDIGKLSAICKEYEKRLSDLNRANEIMASRLIKLERQLPSEE